MVKNKKIIYSFLAVFLLFSIGVLVIPLETWAVDCPPCSSGTGMSLVPCGKSCYIAGEETPQVCEQCKLCDFFVMFDRIFKFILIKVVPPIAALMVVISGVMFFAAVGDPGKVGKAKSLLTSVIIGLAIIYGAYLLINTFFVAMGVAEWTGLKEWFKYPCF